MIKAHQNLIISLYSYGIHIIYYFKTLDLIIFEYKINTSITIGMGTKQEKVNIDKLNITISFGI